MTKNVFFKKRNKKKYNFEIKRKKDAHRQKKKKRFEKKKIKKKRWRKRILRQKLGNFETKKAIDIVGHGKNDLDVLKKSWKT